MIVGTCGLPRACLEAKYSFDTATPRYALYRCGTIAERVRYRASVVNETVTQVRPLTESPKRGVADTTKITHVCPPRSRVFVMTKSSTVFPKVLALELLTMSF